MNQRTLLFALTVTALLSTACASTRSAGDQLSDSGISTKVKSRLAADPDVNPFNIDVDTVDGIVTLRGVVDDAETKAEAIKLAEGTSGVERVVDQIEVGGRGIQARGSDAWIATKVKSKLASDPQINPFNIDVDVTNGRVTLTGKVRYAEAALEAVKLAESTHGVKEVVNNLAVAESNG